ncbi:hypothetical protein VTO42DRAFT_6217 [Malbranchea cinnamomea]
MQEFSQSLLQFIPRNLSPTGLVRPDLLLIHLSVPIFFGTAEHGNEGSHKAHQRLLDRPMAFASTRRRTLRWDLLSRGSTLDG